MHMYLDIKMFTRYNALLISNGCSPSLSPFPSHTHPQKPGGYHLDFLLVGIITFIHGILGIPFVTGAIVRSITQIQSLQMYAPSAAPGEKLKYLGVMYVNN